MLVAEDGHDLVGLSKYGNDLLHPIVTRIKNLSLLISLVIAVLADQQHAFDREFIASIGERVGDRFRQTEAVNLSLLIREIVIRFLVDIEGPDIMLGNMKAAVARIAADKSTGNVIGMRHRTVNRGQRGN